MDFRDRVALPVPHFSSKISLVFVKPSAKMSSTAAAAAAAKRAASWVPPAPTPRKKKIIPTIAEDADEVLRKCRQLRDALRAKAVQDDEDGVTTAVAKMPDDIPSDIVEVSELAATEVLEGMESIALRIAQQVLDKKGFVLDIPSRAASNQVFVKQWDRIVLGGKRSTRSYLNVKVRNPCLLSVIQHYSKSDNPL